MEGLGSAGLILQPQFLWPLATYSKKREVGSRERKKWMRTKSGPSLVTLDLPPTHCPNIHPL